MKVSVERELLADLVGSDHDKRINAERSLYATLANAKPAQEAQGLEVVAKVARSCVWPLLKLSILKDGDELIRLSDATAVIDQLIVERDAARESMYALDELTDKQSDLINTQIKQVAELTESLDSYRAMLLDSDEELAAIKSAPVVMPERKGMNCTDWRQFTDQDIGFNKALAEVARLNRSKT